MYTSPGPNGKLKCEGDLGPIVFSVTVAVSNAILPPAAVCQSGGATEREEDCAAAGRDNGANEKSAQIATVAAIASAVLCSVARFPMSTPVETTIGADYTIGLINVPVHTWNH